MYNLEKRKFMQKVGETPDNVGPSTYFFDSYKTFKQNLAPFLSDTERSKQKKSDLCDSYYNIVVPRHIKGGSSLRNRAKRGENFFDLGPGPSDYDPKLLKRQPAPDPRPPCRGRLYLCTPPKAELTVPSIPTKIDENGYYIDDNGVVVKNPPDEHDTTLGPAYYDVKKSEFFGEYYRGCAWSRRYSRRDTVFDNGLPGPGSYNIPYKIGVFNERDERVREMARLFSYVPRYLDAIEMRVIKEGQPGPGSYNVDISCINQKKSMSIIPQPFVSGSKRWKDIVSDTPAPGTYDIGSMKKRVRSSKTPFGVDAPRFVEKVTQSPCAADYNITQGTIQDKIAKKRQYFGIVQVPFNNSAERKMGFASHDSYDMPSAADYDVQPHPKFPEEASGCNFRSTSRRFKQLESSYDAGPASYNITNSYNKIHKKSSYNVKNVPFLTTGEKCPGVKSVSKLGPADYNKQGDMYGHGKSFGTAMRFREKFEDLPGPGAYTVSPVYGSAIYKGIGTHNLHLRESVLRKRLRLPPCKTFEAWCKEIKKRRKLQCYKKEKDDIDYVGLLFSDV
nr:sperm-tail PG-rich repeat-containing protein 2-like [Onthophagus taurus]